MQSGLGTAAAQPEQRPPRLEAGPLQRPGVLSL